nr:reverse transcriptase [Tanacetum cinerariifolium]
MVKELLEVGVIIESQSLFSSPIVMVKKKDGTWRMCVDYKQLNKFTMKDKFPILVVEKLIDEFANEAKHLQHLQEVLDVTRTHTLYAKQNKYTFLAPQVEYLGHVLSAQGVATDPLKIQAMASWHIPITLKQLKVLALPNFEKEFVVETDASGCGIVLYQNGHPNAYLSKALSLRHQALSTYEKEFMADVMAMDRWRGYLLDRNFKIKIDHFSLKYLLNQRLTTLFQTKWLPKLLGFDYEISYKKGDDNEDDDALSRCFELNEITTTTVSTDLLKRIETVGKRTSLYKLKDYLFTYVHATSIEIHSEVNVTLKTLKAMVYWKVAQVFMENVFKLYGLPHSIINDRDKVFLSHFWKSLFKVLKVNLQMSTDYHPQSDGQPEVVKRCLECYLSGALPAFDIDGLMIKTPATILDRRLGKLRNSPVMYVLVQWHDESVEDATWETYGDLITRFSTFDQAF